MTWLDPAEVAAYANRRTRATNQYQIQQAQNSYNRGTTGANQATSTRNLTTQFDKMRTNLPGQYARRGLLNSGIYAQGLQDYGTGRTSAFGDLAQRYQQQFGQFDLNDQAASVNYNDTIGEIYDQEAVRRSQVAAALRGF